MTPGQEQEKALLEDFYSLTYPLHLGIPFPGLVVASRYGSIHAFLDQCVDSEKKKMIEGRLVRYRDELTPRLRLNTFEEALPANTEHEIRAVLDFGCGNGCVLQQLALHCSQVEHAYGIEIGQQALALASKLDFREGVSVHFGRELPTNRQGLKFDLILSSYTLHHIDDNQQQSVISTLVELLTESGLLIILEDSWETPTLPGSPHTQKLDERFCSLSVEHKRGLYLLNDRHSNEWIHRRMLACDKASYRAVDDWKRCLLAGNAVPVSERVAGFDMARLHGVPSACIVARKRR